MSFGTGGYGTTYYGGGDLLFQVVSAVAVNPHTIVVTFSDLPDTTDPETLNPANYYIDVVAGGTLIGAPSAVFIDPDPYSVRLVTSPTLEYIQYKVTVNSLVTDINGTEVDDEINFAEFTGFPEARTAFEARALRANAVTLVFKQPMLVDSFFSDPLNYTIRSVSGTFVPILSVTPNMITGATRATLELGENLSSNVFYSVRVSSSVHTAEGLSIVPDTTIFIWNKRVLQLKVPMSLFTGEVRRGTPDWTVSEALSLQESVSILHTPIAGDDYALGAGEYLPLHESLEILPLLDAGRVSAEISDLFGAPDGLVFFSPSLVDGGAPGSSLQVEEVKTCTTAYDSYSFPQPIDPRPLYTHGGTVTPTTYPTELNRDVLFTNFYRLGEAKMVVHFKPTDWKTPPVDIEATMVVREMWPPARVALLNNPAWTLVDAVATTPPYNFITADNLTPFPAPTSGVVHHVVSPAEILGVGEVESLLYTTVPNGVENLSLSESLSLPV
jgi:hypothetical protein